MRRLGLLTHKFPPFDTWEELQHAIEEAGLWKTESPPEGIPLSLAISLECISVFHTFLSCCAMSSFIAIMENKQNPKPKLQATFSIFAGMTTDVAAVELLARHGFDIQAKNLVRSLREKLDALIAVQLDRSFAVEFVSADGSDEANKFWHRRVSRGKLLRNISKRLSHYSADGESPIDKWWLEERKKLDLWLGEAVHPSHMTGFLSAFPTSGLQDDDSEGMGLFGHPSELSIPTARTVLSFAQEVILLMRARRLVPQSDKKYRRDEFLDDHRLTFERFYSAGEKFLIVCASNSSFAPNLEMMKLQMFLEGYMMVPIAGDVDHKAYEVEMLRALSKVLAAAKERLEDMVDKAESSKQPL